MLNGDIILKRDINKNKYDLSLLDNIKTFSDDKRLDLLILIKKVILSSNNSYYFFFLSKLKKEFLILILKNLAFFCVINQIFNIIQFFSEDSILAKKYFKLFPNDNIKLKINRVLIFIIPELIILLLYKFPKYLRKNKSILSLMHYINERYQYAFNNNDENDLICKVNNDNKFDIHIFIKKYFDTNNNLKLYSNPIKSLSKNIFFDYVIIYSNNILSKFNYMMCNNKEIEIIIKIFYEIKKFEKNFEKNNKNNLIYKLITIPLKSIIELKGIKYNIIIILFLKTILLLFEVYLEKINIDDIKLIHYENIKKKINSEIVKNGYFFDLNNDIIILYRIKTEYSSMEDNYNYLCSESRKLLSSKY